MLRAMLAMRLCIVSSALLLFGCAYGEVRQVVRAQFASELNCPEVQMKKRDVWYSYDSPDQYKVSGCGVMRTYTCPKTEGLVSYDKPVCTWVAGDADAPQMRTMPAEDEMDMPDEADAPLLEEAPAAPEPKAKPAPKKAAGKVNGGAKLPVSGKK